MGALPYGAVGHDVDDDRRPADTVTVSVPARAALAGNPSDGHGGAVVAMPIHEFAAQVTVRPADRFTVLVDGGRRPIDPGAGPIAPDDDGAVRLVDATLRAIDRLTGRAPDPVTVEVATTIPRSVGLAGSSAIVVATIRAMAATSPHDEHDAFDDPAAVAVCALEAERTELGIAAGLQDRLVQAWATTVVMDFHPEHDRRAFGLPAGDVRELPRPPGQWLLAWRPASAGDSGTVHGRLRERRDDPSVRALIVDLAARAHAAAAAIESADVAALGSAMDRTFDLRRRLMPLDPRHVEMIEAARSAGGHANYTGSGGAVIVLGADGDVADAALDRLRALDGVRAIPVDPTARGGAPSPPIA